MEHSLVRGFVLRLAFLGLLAVAPGCGAVSDEGEPAEGDVATAGEAAEVGPELRPIEQVASVAQAAVGDEGPAAVITYYVSSVSGNDANDGLSSARPFRTLAKVSSTPLVAGAHVLFKADETFYGQLSIDGSGTASAPIVIGKFGAGLDPVLSGSGANIAGGDFESTIVLRNTDYIEVQDLTITNDRTRDRAGVGSNVAYGIDLRNTDGSVMTHFRFHDLTFSRILPPAVVAFNDNRGQAIHIETAAAAANPQARIDDVVIEDCFFTLTGKVAISATNAGATDPANDLQGRNTNLIIRNNRSFLTGGSFFVPSKFSHALVENNVIEYTGAGVDPRMANRGSGMWFFNSRNIVAQHNTVLFPYGPGDSYGIHTDYSNKYTLVQYNYTQGAYGGFIEILGDNDYATYRYNISVNEGGRANANTFWFSDYAGNNRIKSSNVYAYNNSVYVDESALGQALSTGISLIGAASGQFYNNLMHVAGTSSVGVDLCRLDANTDINNNFLFNEPAAAISPTFLAADSAAIRTNPLYLSAGAFCDGAYQLQSGSPALQRARPVVEPASILPAAGSGIFSGVTAKASRDYFGNAVDLSRSDQHIGAYNGPGLDAAAAAALQRTLEFPNQSINVPAPGSELDLSVGRVALTSPNHQTARYFIASGNTNDTFYINQWTGELKNRKPIPTGTVFSLNLGAEYVKSADELSQNFVYDTLTATVTVRANLLPVANAGADRTVTLNTPVTLDGRASSDPDNAPSPLTYSWVQLAGPSVGLSGASTSQPRFTPTVAGSYSFRLSVSDGSASSQDTVVITVANASISLPGRIQAEAYRTGGEGVGYHDLTSGNSGGAFRSDDVDIQACTDSGGGFNVGWVQAGEWLAFAVDVAQSGTYTLTARVASAQTGTKTMTASVDGVSKATFSTQTSAGWQSWTNVVVNNVNLSAGQHELRLLFNSNSLNVNYLDVALQPNQAPVANAGADRSLTINTAVTLDGRASSDPDAGPAALTYSWAQLSGPTVVLTNAQTAQPSFTPTSVGSYGFRLTVSDGQASATDDVTITASSAANLLLNGNFSSGTSSWSAYYGAPATGGFVVESVNGNPAARLTITNSGTALHLIQFRQILTLRAGKAYVLEFDIRSESAAKRFTVFAEENGLDYTSYFSATQTIAAANTWQRVSVTWTQPETKEAKVGVKLGTYNTSDVWVDNVVLR